MLVTYILVLSIAVQAAAAVLAFRLIRITGRRMAWIFICAALALAAIRRVISLYRLISGELTVLEPLDEFLGLVLSAAMAAGIAWIGPLFVERRQAEQELREREEYIRRLVENSPVPMLVSSGTEEQVIFVGKRFTDLFGYTIRDMPDVAHWWPLAYPDEKYREEIKARWSAKVEKAVREGGEIEPMEARVRCRDGSHRYIEFRFSSFGARNLVTFADVTERKKAEEEYRTILRTAMDGYWLNDIHGNFLDVNDAYCKITGYSRSELLSMKISDVEAVETPEDTARHIRKVIETGSDRFETRHRCKDGRLVDLEVSVTGLKGEDTKLFVFLRDITERRKAEQQLALVNFALDHVHEEAFLTDEQARFRYVNDESCRALGFSRDELLGMTVADVDPDFPLTRWPQHWRDLQVRRSLRFEGRHKARDGRFYPVEISANYFEFKGRGYILGLVRDITERNRMLEAMRGSEQRLALHVMQTPLGVIEWNLDFEVTEWNPAAERIFGYSRSEALGAHASLIVPPSAKEQVDQVWNDLKRKKGGLRSTNENKMKDGRHIYCEWYNTPLVDADGSVIAVASLVQDVTERVKAEREVLRLNAELEQRVVRRTADLRRKSEELQEIQRALMNIVEDLNLKTGELEQANIKLTELDRLKSMFIASMSHELRTPLNSIIGFSSIMLHEWAGPMTSEQKENLGAVLRSGKYLLSLINDVIDVSKIEAGVVESVAEEFDVYDLVTEAVAAFAKDAEKKGLELKVESIHQSMRTDRRRLLQCLLNLMSNAVKFTERGVISVCAKITGKGKSLEISVSDTGIGMSEDGMRKLFSPFVRLESPLKSRVPGTGLGLYLTKKLMTDVLKGDIFITSRPGEGSTFTLRAPVAGSRGHNAKSARSGRQQG